MVRLDKLRPTNDWGGKDKNDRGTKRLAQVMWQHKKEQLYKLLSAQSTRTTSSTRQAAFGG